MFPIRKCVAVLGLIALPMVGCGGGGGAGGPSFQTTRGQFHELQFSATTRTTYKQGETVIVTLDVKNTSAQTFSFDYGNCAPDQAQVQQQGRVLITFDDMNVGCPAFIQHAAIAPGQTVTYKQVWDQKVPSNSVTQPVILAPPGQYQIVSGLSTVIENVVPGAPPLTITIQ